MSRLGRKPIPIPDGVKVALQDREVRIEGPKGKLSRRFHADVSVSVDGAKKQVLVGRSGDLRQHRALHGATRSLIAGMIEGVTKSYEKKLEIVGVGYNGKVQGRDLILQLGFSHPIKVPVPEGLTATCPSPTLIEIIGADKHQIGQFAADIRALRPPEPYNLKGIRYAGEVIRKKAGKTFVSGA